VLYVHFSTGTALDYCARIALTLDLEPAHFRGDLVRQIADAVVRLNQSKKQHPILICDEAHLLPHPALEQLPLLLNSTWTLSLSHAAAGRSAAAAPALSLQMHEALRQRIGTHITWRDFRARTRRLSGAATEGRWRDSALFDDTARQGLYQATKGIPPEGEQVGDVGVASGGRAPGSAGRRSDPAGCHPRRCYELTKHRIELPSGVAPGASQGRGDGLAPFTDRPTEPPGKSRGFAFVGIRVVMSPRRPWAFNAKIA